MLISTNKCLNHYQYFIMFAYVVQGKHGRIKGNKIVSNQVATYWERACLENWHPKFWLLIFPMDNLERKCKLEEIFNWKIVFCYQRAEGVLKRAHILGF